MKRHLPIVLGGILLGAFLYRTSLAAIGNIRWGSNLLLLLAIGGLNGLPLLLKTYRWRFLLESRGVSVIGKPLFTTVSAGFFFGLSTPGTSGEFMRGTLLGLRGRDGFSTVAFEKLCDFTVLSVLSIASTILVGFGNASWFLPLIGLSVALFAAFALLPQASHRRSWKKSVVRLLRGRYRKGALRAARAFNDLARNRGIYLRSVLVSVALWVVPLIQFMVILQILQIRVRWEVSAASFFGPYLIGVVSLIPFGLGITDLGITHAMAGLSGAVVLELGGIAVILFRLLVTLPLVLWGFGCFIWGRIGDTRLVPVKSHHSVL